MTYKYTLYIPPSLSKSGNSEVFGLEATDPLELAGQILRHRLDYENHGLDDTEVNDITRCIETGNEDFLRSEKVQTFVDETLKIAVQAMNESELFESAEDSRNALRKAVECCNSIPTTPTAPKLPDAIKVEFVRQRVFSNFLDVDVEVNGEWHVLTTLYPSNKGYISSDLPGWCETGAEWVCRIQPLVDRLLTALKQGETK
jgi:hypothetical protein